MSDDLALARAAMARIPVFAGFKGNVERLGGLTNLVFRAGDWCLRIPGKGTEEYINRANEAVAAREAAKAGVAPEVTAFRRGPGHHGDAVHRRRRDDVAGQFQVAAGCSGASRHRLPAAARQCRRIFRSASNCFR